MAETFLAIEGVTKSFSGVEVIKGVDLTFGKGEFVSFLGPSGCGKTTVLRMVAGFETPTAGRILIGGEEVTHVKPQQRKIGMVFQAYALFPNMNVADNIGFGLKVAGVPRDQARKRVGEMLDLIGLPHLAERYAFELSGGQQQRVALARALAPRPRMLLLDEPLSALDAKIRVSLRDQIREIQRELGITTIFVTHDQEEALSISDRIVVMNAGAVEQVGAPFEIYNTPATPFVAGFVGTLNTIPAIVAEPARREVTIGQTTLAVPTLPDNLEKGASVALALRPEAVRLAGGEPGEVVIEGIVRQVSFLGSVIRLGVEVAGGTVSLDSFNDRRTAPPEVGEKLRIGFAPADIVSVTRPI
jgi:putative spermidine/putrescine transport system ATP-binding protein